MRKIVFLIGAVAVLIGLFLLVGEEATEDVTEVNQKSSIADENQNKSIAPAHWESFSKTQTDFSFSYPPQAEISNEAGRIKVQVIGPQNKIDTEITDGFTLFLDTKEKNDQTLEKLAQNHFDEITQRLRPINQPTRDNTRENSLLL